MNKNKVLIIAAAAFLNSLTSSDALPAKVRPWIAAIGSAVIAIKALMSNPNTP